MILCKYVEHLTNVDGEMEPCLLVTNERFATTQEFISHATKPENGDRYAGKQWVLINEDVKINEPIELEETKRFVVKKKEAA